MRQTFNPMGINKKNKKISKTKTFWQEYDQQLAIEKGLV